MTGIVVTGLGVLSAAGTGAEAFFAALRRGKPVQHTAKTALQSFDATAYGDPEVAEVADFDPTKLLGDKGLRTLDRVTFVAPFKMGVSPGYA